MCSAGDEDNRIEVNSIVNTNPTNFKNLNSLFINCTKLTKVENFEGLDTVTNTSYMFDGCTNLISISGFDLSSAVNTSNMFDGCTNLISLSDFDKLTYELFKMILLLKIMMMHLNVL